VDVKRIKLNVDAAAAAGGASDVTSVARHCKELSFNAAAVPRSPCKRACAGMTLVYVHVNLTDSVVMS